MAEPPPSPSPSSLAELIVSLEQATMAAKQLPSTAETSHLLQIHSSLHHAHNHLSAFLSRPQFRLPLLPPPPENSLSSAVADPMQLADDDEDENENDDDVDQVNSRGIVDGVEERMRNCFIKNKRRKRRLSPEEKRFDDDGFRPVTDGLGFDPYATRLRALELVYQFHG